MPGYTKEVIVFLIASNFIVIGFAVFSYFILRIQQKRKILHRAQLLEKEYKTRTETIANISRDLHDEIGSSLSGISMFSQLALSQLEQDKQSAAAASLHNISQYTGAVIEKTGDMVWMLQPGNDTEARYFERLQHYAMNVTAARHITFSFTTDHSFKWPVQQLLYRKNIFLICKEAINNAVKYSGCTMLTINCTNKSISIGDNGTGFNEADITPGSGLRNMQHRASECGVTVKIDSATGKGTCIEILL